jgi:Protein of unknown function (DUF3311)
MASDPEVLPDGPDSAAPAVPAGGRRVRTRSNPDWQPWVPLLIVPIVLPLITTIFNRAEPKLWGIPAFYWIQLAYVFLSAACTGIVYATSKSRRR